MKIMDSDLLDAYALTKRFVVQPGNTIDAVKQCTVFIDLDGVICDFNGHFEDLFGIHPHTHKDSDVDFWAVFNKNPVGFFRNLKPYPGYLEFLAFAMRHAAAYGYNVKFLTALCTMNAVSLVDQLQEKFEWITKYVLDYGLAIPIGYVEHSSDKKNFAEYGHILIDDLKSNVDEWRECQGTAIYHKNFQTSMVDLMAALEVLHEKK